MKVLLFVVQLISIPLMFKIVSSKPSFLSNIGRYSLPIYLLHMIVVHGIRVNFLKGLTFTDANLFTITYFLIAFTYCFILSRKPIVEKLDKFINIKI